MALIRFNALVGTWELRGIGALDYSPITCAAAQLALVQGVRQEPMWRGPPAR